MTADLVRVRVQLPFSSADGFAKFGPSWTDLLIREGTSDEDVLREVWLEDCYRVRGIDLTPRVTTYEHEDESGIGTSIRTKTEGRTVLDIGACTGIFSALCLAFGAAHMIAVEPEPDNVRLLRKNLAPYGDRVTIIEGAVTGDGHDVQLLGGQGTGHTERSLADPLAIDERESIPSRTLADIIDLAPTPIVLMKMDVEGAEFDIIDACPSEAIARVENIAMETHGPATAAHLDPATIDQKYGALLAKLAYTHAITAFGVPSRGGMLFAHAYDQREGHDDDDS